MRGLGSNPGSGVALLFLLTLGFCTQDPGADVDVLAEAYGESLTRKELMEKMPEGLNPRDSQNLAEELVDRWVKERVLLRKAQKELKEKSEELDERVEAYRRSLLVNSLENNVLKEELDSQVTEEEMRRFYSDHRKEFSLKEAVVQVDHVQLSRDSLRYYSAFRRALNKEGTEAGEELKGLCEGHAIHCYLSGGEWRPLSRILAETPLEVENEEEFLNKRTLVRKDLDEGVFLLKVRDHRSSGEVSPFSLVKDRVKWMILDRRKTELLDRSYQNALSDARKKNKVRFD